MRTPAQRLRHAILFELIGILIVTPLGAWLLDRPAHEVGGLAVFFSLLATLANYLFNLAFDHALIKLGRALDDRPPWLRLLHATLFELSLLVVGLPVIAWWLEMTLLEALIADLGFMGFFLVYAYLYNWIYDAIAPHEPHPRPQT